MRLILFVLLLLAPIQAQATECKGLLSIIGIDTGLSCEQRAAMTSTGIAMMNAAPRPMPAPAPAPVIIQPVPQPPKPTFIFPAEGGAPIMLVPVR